MPPREKPNFGATKRAKLRNDITSWILNNPRIMDWIIWDYGGHNNYPFSQWYITQKNDLVETFVNIGMGDSNLSSTPDRIDLFGMQVQQKAVTTLSYSTAWQYFISHVALSLYVEIYHKVNWSILNYTNLQLSRLFAFTTFFKFNTNYRSLQLYTIETVHGDVTPGDPLRTQTFLKNNNIIKSTPRSTTEELVLWCSNNLTHFVNGTDFANFFSHWQYWGMPPVEKIISGTIRRGETSPRHWTAGCKGTVGFLKAVLRTVNIPVELVFRCGHAVPHFLLDDTYFSHGDDPYSWLIKTAHPPIPMSELFISANTFSNWLPETAVFSITPDCVNVGKRTAQLGIDNLPNYLLYTYCQDKMNNISHQNGSVFNEIFKPHGYSVADLDNANLWARMDDKINQVGGCTNIPRDR